MSPETEEKLAKVRKYSTSLRRVFNFFTAFVAIGGSVSLLILLTRSGDDVTLAVWSLEFSGDEITGTLKLLAAVWILLVFGIALRLLRHLAALFDLYANGRIFTAENVREIRQIGISVFLFAITWIYAAGAKLLLLATGHPLPPSPRDGSTLGLDVDFSVIQILAGIIIIVISWIMDVGRELREEQDLTV